MKKNKIIKKIKSFEKNTKNKNSIIVSKESINKHF